MEKQIEIRKYLPSDLERLYKICLLTGNSGKDASDIYRIPELLADYYVAPYAFLEPDLTFVVTLDAEPNGYILGTKDSTEFSENCEKEWFPNLRKKYKFPDSSDHSADANIIRLIYNGYKVKDELLNYPAHLHINLLPELQGMGLGKKLITLFAETLKSMRVGALHLEVGKKNLGAIKFYEKAGFHVITEYERSIAYGMKIS